VSLAGLVGTGLNWSNRALAKLNGVRPDMSQISLPEQKARLRNVMYLRRAKAATDAADSGAQLAARVMEHLNPLLEGASDGLTVSAFLPIRTEIDTLPVVTALADAGATVVLPTIEGDSPDLVFRAWAPGDALATGSFGVKEPMSDQPALDPSVLVIPLLAFDCEGYRLGYGGGYYDRAIARLRRDAPVATVGVAYDAQEVVHVPREGHDERLDAIVTPTRTLVMESR